MYSKERLFTEAAKYYARYRPGYPEAFFAKVGEEYKLDGTGRLLDLGCGTGQLAIPLASGFNEVVGIDPEGTMLTEAEKQASNKGIMNTRWLKGRAEELDSIGEPFGVFKLATIGNAFHWMDQVKTLSNLDQVIEPGGGVVIVKNPTLWYKPNEWQEIVLRIIKKYLGEERRAGDGKYVKQGKSFKDVLLSSSFNNVARHTFPFQHFWSIEGIVGYLYSTSFCSPNLLGENKRAFESDLGGALLDLNPNGTFVENNETTALFARRSE
jgi:ubiquinone/menaquinone biosynthesis C-methylase UbiE